MSKDSGCIFIVKAEEIDGPERKTLDEKAFRSRTNAVKEMKAIWDREKRNGLIQNHTTQSRYSIKISN